MLFNQAYEEMQIRDYITGRKQIAAIEKLDQKEGNLQRSEIAFSEGSLKSSETVAKDLIYVGRHGSCKLLYQVVTPGNTRAGTAILSSYYRPARRSREPRRYLTRRCRGNFLLERSPTRCSGRVSGRARQHGCRRSKSGCTRQDSGWTRTSRPARLLIHMDQKPGR